MATKSDFSAGLATKVCGAWHDAGGSPQELNELAQDTTTLAKVVAVMRGVLTFATPTLSIWKTIEIGGKTVSELQKELEKKGLRISDWARQILAKVKAGGSPRTINLVRMTVRDLGFTNPNNLPTTTDVFRQVKNLGGTLCPAEVGPHLRLAYGDQPRGEWLWVTMEPVTDSDGSPLVFGLYRDGDDPWLSVRYSNPESRWGLEYSIVFSAS